MFLANVDVQVGCPSWFATALVVKVGRLMRFDDGRDGRIVA